MHIYYLLENTQQCKLPLSNYGTIIYGNGKTNSSANCLYLIIMGPLSMENKQQCNQFEQENSLYTQKIVAIKRGLGRKNRAGKKSRRIRDEKHTMCEWDH